MMYRLDENKNPILDEVGQSWANQERCVVLSYVNNITVSTVFLVFNHNYHYGKPILFETMTFPNKDQERYCTWNEAVAGHVRWVAKSDGTVADPQKLRLWK
jgi:hypothetical protein